MAHMCVLICQWFIHIYLPATRPICDGGTKDTRAASAIAVLFTCVNTRGLQST